MSSNPTLILQLSNVQQLAESLLDRFQQLLLWLPLPAEATEPKLLTFYPLALQLPGDEESRQLQTCVQCYIHTNGRYWLGVTLEQQMGHEYEQRIRYLTREHKSQYGKLLQQLFAR